MAKPPTPKQLSVFAAMFTKLEWDRLCIHRSFTDALVESVPDAWRIAEKLLGRQIKAKD
jgi:hypothetical protein